jgi:hypothetical protein
VTVPGQLTPDQQLQVLAKIWGNHKGYVFLPVIEGSARTPEARRKSYHEGKAFEWPNQRDAIAQRLHDHTGDDVYFTPNLFNSRRRTENAVARERSLYADLDPVDPHHISEYRPTIAWETSPGRYQGVWLMDKPKEGASWYGKENHRLSLHLGADPSGWDATQLLRVPGRANYKPDYGNGVPGRLLWDNGPRYQWHEFDDLPEVPTLDAQDDVEMLDDELLAGIDRQQLWRRVRMKVSKRVREYVVQRVDPGGETDRSDVLWEIERELADAGCTVAEIVALVRGTVWNKYKGRNDELRRLKTEAAKAHSQRADEPLEEVQDETERPEELPSFHAWNRSITQRPTWLVPGVWTDTGCGFIAGAPKSYKSWMAVDLALSVATGSAWLGLPQHRVRTPQVVLYIQEEDGVAIVKDRMNKVLEARCPAWYTYGQLELRTDVVPPTQVPGPRHTPGGSVRGHTASVAAHWAPPQGEPLLRPQVQAGFIGSDPGWQDWLEAMVMKYGAKLVVIDTLGMTAGELDTDRAQELNTRLLGPLKQLANRLGFAVCLVHHNRKSQNGQTTFRAGAEMLGSVALHAWADCFVGAQAGERTEERERQVQLQLRTKQSPDLDLRVRIPEMYANERTGERQLWQPLLMEAEPDEPEPAPRKQPKTGKARYNEAAMHAKLRGVGLARGPVLRSNVEDALGARYVKHLIAEGTLLVEGSRLRWKR